MKRSPMPRRETPLRRTTELRRTGPIRRVNRERRERRFERAYESDARVEWIHGLGCATCPAPDPSECSHVLTRAAGGGPDDMIPQCFGCHDAFHSLGRETFEREYDVNLASLAAEYARRWRERLPR